MNPPCKVWASVSVNTGPLKHDNSLNIQGFISVLIKARWLKMFGESSI